MNWEDILKKKNNHLDVIQNLFNTKEKAIGYIPIEWGIGKENEIQQMASRLGLQYKVFPSKNKTNTPHEKWHSYSNGGHFMWNENKVNSILEQTEFNSADELIAFIAHNDYRHKPYRKVIDTIFGTPNVTLIADKVEQKFKGKQRGFE